MPSLNFFNKRKTQQTTQPLQPTATPISTPDAPDVTSPSAHLDPPPIPPIHRSSTGSSSPDKRNRSKDLFKGKENPTSPRSNSSSKTASAFHKRSGSNRKNSEDSHPLNLPPEELRRLSQLSTAAMASPSPSPKENGVFHDSDPMEMTPAPETPGAFPETNGVNGEHSDEEAKPPPPPHRTPTSPPPEANGTAGGAGREQEAEGFKQSGNKFYKNKQYRQAIQEYSKAIEADPKSATYLSNRAAAYMADNSWAEALEDCKLADELEPDSAKILHRLAKVYTALGRPKEALEVYARIEPPAAAKDSAPATQMQNYLQQAENSLNGDSSGSMARIALDQAEKGLGSTVQPPRRWRLMRGEAYLKMGNVNSLGDAQNIAMALLRSNNQDPEALVLRGRALYAQGENDKAIQHFRQALSCDPDFKDAVKYLRMVQKLDRLKEEGNTHYKASRWQPAVDVYTTALGVDALNKGTNSKILNNRAMCYSKQKKYDEAIKDCDQAIKLDPSYTKARKTRAKALGEGGDWEEAVRAYKTIAESNPEEPGIAKDVRHAELELKKSKRKDYYKIMGVDKQAADADIKRAYKKLAVKHHPDKNPDDPEAEDRFKDISEAYETLIDPQKRNQYDSGVDLMEPGEGFGGGGFPGGMGGMHGGMGGMQIDPEMLFNMMGGGMGGGGGARGFPGGGGGGFSFSTGGPGMGGGRGGQGFSPFG